MVAGWSPVQGLYSSITALQQGATNYLAAVYNADPASVAFTGTYADHTALAKALGESPAWYKSEQMRERFKNYCEGKKIDPKPFFPPGYYQPTIPDTSIYIFGF